jgi:hypothetical protein
MFGNKEEKRAQEAAAAAEIKRLCALPVADLAAKVLAAYGPDGPQRVLGKSPGSIQIANWLTADYPRRPNLKPLVLSVRRAIPVLETAGLLGPELSSSGGSRVDITGLGEKALRDGTAREQLAAAGAGSAAGAGQRPLEAWY